MGHRRVRLRRTAAAGRGRRALDRRPARVRREPGRRPQRLHVDAADVAEVAAGGAHIVGHSYGAVVAMLAAARWPDRVRSLALIEPAAHRAAGGDPIVSATLLRMRASVARAPEMSPEEWLRASTEAVGVAPLEPTPARLRAAATAMRERPCWDAVVPIEQLAAARWPKLVIAETGTARPPRIARPRAMRSWRAPVRRRGDRCADRARGGRVALAAGAAAGRGERRPCSLWRSSRGDGYHGRVAGISSEGDLRALHAPPSERALRKQLDHIDPHCRRFIGLSPFVVMATAGADGRVDATRGAATPGSSRSPTSGRCSCPTGRGTTGSTR